MVATESAVTQPGRALWRDGRFATFWAGESISVLGDQVSALALPLVAVTILHAGPSAVGLLTAAAWLPFAAALFIGAWVDGRGCKKSLMIIANIVQGAAVATVPLAHFVWSVSMAQLYVVAALTGLAGVVMQTAYPTFFVALVRKDQYLEANSLLSISRSGASLVGPPVTGILIQLLTAPVAVLVDAVSFLVSAFALHRVRTVERAPDPDGPSSLTGRAISGLRCVWHNRYLRANLLCSTTLNFGSFMVSALAILFASRQLQLSAGVIGTAFGVGASGALLGAALARPIGRLLGVGRTITLGAALSTAPLAVIPLAGGGVLAKAAVLAAAEFLSAFGIMTYDINNNAVKTVVTPDAMRSRVSGAFSTINYGSRPLGAVIGGALGARLGVAPTMVAGAAIGTLGACWMIATPLGRVRTIEGLPPG